MKTVVTLSSKGQFTLPAAMRTALGLERGARMEVTVDESNRSITISPVPDIEQLSARVTAYAQLRAPVTEVDAYYQEHRGKDTKA
ncbi:AbrB/MazE/SpoVT family DNA-binding domain-containing protein [Cryobacterium sp. SO1]|uniref:AbrB/MazE/SpoVT family DNA-binding domain-containing protein n=1 Tax=Cryobacterium sp. SO1 TaxID=1897061 RepID=UPI0010E21124|nr:AbrB/MazE/SpoVT family DNA-binding domain-containing protein [Cryobacterium sp. SO1]RZI34610.1 hypothetical protein BJQ95_03068 [Cryobacterium sp. SO1]